MSTIDLIITCKTPFGYKLDSNWLEQSCNRNSLWFSISGEFVTVSGGGECRRESEKEDERLFCYVMYSSGSTGKPKGVCGTEQGLWNRFLWMQELYPLNGEEVLLFKTAISFVDHFQEFLNAILTGSALVIPPFNQLKQNVFFIVDFLQSWLLEMGRLCVTTLSMHGWMLYSVFCKKLPEIRIRLFNQVVA
ncbi:putative acyl-activating enzyme 19 isoform X1 [Rosa rugosa]|uniref:putative acyl-activating enzyme 19 isoform X1 n=1 Tax=Rosa rugosa TaxID=74645 RepID=UPI002B4029E5|nr:putative acyl-activating enzyme 19 isoform X1 [Rosa rugosa]